MSDLGRLVSPHFSLGELVVCGDWARWQRHQIAGLGVMPAHGPRETVEQRLEVLATTILEPIREHVGRPVHSNSGYRCPAKNKATPGSSSTTQHVFGEADDLRVDGLTDAELVDVWAWIAWESGLPFGQVIAEDRRPGVEGGGWIHVSLGAPYRPSARCGQVKSCDFVGGKPVYTDRTRDWWVSPAGRAWRQSRGAT